MSNWYHFIIFFHSVQPIFSFFLSFCSIQYDQKLLTTWRISFLSDFVKIIFFYSVSSNFHPSLAFSREKIWEFFFHAKCYVIGMSFGVENYLWLFIISHCVRYQQVVASISRVSEWKNIFSSLLHVVACCDESSYIIRDRFFPFSTHHHTTLNSIFYVQSLGIALLSFSFTSFNIEYS